MEITPTLMYWIITGPQLATGLRFIFFLTGVIFLISVACVIASDDFNKKVKKVWKFGIISSLAFLLCMSTILVPSTKEFAMIYVIPKIANHQAVSKLPDKIVDLGMAQLEKWTNDLKGE
jgi:hypothetical protein